MKTVDIDVAGMSCGHCVAAVTKALEKVPGVRVVKVEVGHARVEAEDATERAALEAAIRDEGYTVTGA